MYPTIDSQTIHTVQAPITTFTLQLTWKYQPSSWNLRKYNYIDINEHIFSLSFQTMRHLMAICDACRALRYSKLQHPSVFSCHHYRFYIWHRVSICYLRLGSSYLDKAWLVPRGLQTNFATVHRQSLLQFASIFQWTDGTAMLDEATTLEAEVPFPVVSFFIQNITHRRHLWNSRKAVP